MTAKSPEAAAERLRAEPGIIHRLVLESRCIENETRRHHPEGYAVLDAELDFLLRGAGAYPHNSVEQLWAVETAHAKMVERKAEADAEVARLAEVHNSMAAQRRRDIEAGGNIGRPSRDAALLEALRLAKLRLDAVSPTLGDGSEEDFQAVLDDIEAALKALGSSVNVSRRSSNARIRSAAAASAVEAAKASMSAEGGLSAEAA